MNRSGTSQDSPNADPGKPEPRPYQPPRLSGKQALEQVTLFSFTCDPANPTCPLGHP